MIEFEWEEITELAYLQSLSLAGKDLKYEVTSSSAAHRLCSGKELIIVYYLKQSRN